MGRSVLIVLWTVIVFNSLLFRALGSFSPQEERYINLYILKLSEAYLLHHLKAGFFFLMLGALGEVNGKVCFDPEVRSRTWFGVFDPENYQCIETVMTGNSQVNSFMILIKDLEQCSKSFCSDDDVAYIWLFN